MSLKAGTWCFERAKQAGLERQEGHRRRRRQLLPRARKTAVVCPTPKVGVVVMPPLLAFPAAPAFPRLPRPVSLCPDSQISKTIWGQQDKMTTSKELQSETPALPSRVAHSASLSLTLLSWQSM